MLFRYAVLPVTRISTLQKRAHVLGRLYVGGQPKRNVNRVCSWDTAFRRDDAITRFIPAVIKPLLVGCFVFCQLYQYRQAIVLQLHSLLWRPAVSNAR